jgi:hypothetical protein
MRERIYAALSVGLLLITACVEPTGESWSDTTEDAPNREFTPTCLPGCTETDPDTSAPGIFLSSAVTEETCFGTTATDRDQDGVPDRCENDLSTAFRPELAITGSDRTGREPKVAVKGYPNSGIIRIAYMLSYYTDDGPTTSWCNNNFVDLFDQQACHGHFGDAELIVLDVYYNPSTKHWVLHYAGYSEHETWNSYPRGTAAYPKLVYPNKGGGYPRAYVSYQKHANYATDRECDSGAKLGTDTCNPTRFERITSGGIPNIGSRSVHTSGQDCWASTNPLYQNGRLECYWTGARFKGWQTGNPDSDPYGPKLASWGF